MWTIITIVVVFILFWVVRTLTSKRMKFWRIANQNADYAFCFFMSNPKTFAINRGGWNRIDRNIYDAGPFVFAAYGNRFVLYANSDSLVEKQEEFVHIIQSAENHFMIYELIEELAEEAEAVSLDDLDVDAIESDMALVAYAQGDTVDLADGQMGDFIGYLPDGVTARVAIEDELTGEPNTIEVHKGLIVGLSEVAEVSTEATAPVVEQEAPPVVQEPAIPLQKDGTPDYEAMSAGQFLEHYGNKYSHEEAMAELSQARESLEKQIEKIKKGSQSLSRNTQERNLRKIVELQTRLDDITSVIGEKAVPIAAIRVASAEEAEESLDRTVKRIITRINQQMPK